MNIQRAVTPKTSGLCLKHEIKIVIYLPGTKVKYEEKNNKALSEA